MSVALLRRRKHFFLVATTGLFLYGTYKFYNHSSITARRRRLLRLFKTLVSVADAASSTADTVSLLLTDLNRFLISNSDEIPKSLKQITKIARSDEFSTSVSRVSESLIAGTVKGFGSGSSFESEIGFTDKILEKLFSSSGSGFISVVAGSFARNLVLGFYLGSSTDGSSSSSSNWIQLLCDEERREFVADCIRIFVSNAVTVYLDKTMDVNTYDEFFSGLTNPNHEAKVKDFLVSVCNGAVETAVKSSHQVLTASSEGEHVVARKGSSDERIKEIGRWVNQVSRTLALPGNRSLVLDVTGRVTFETVKSFLEFVMWKVGDGAKRSASFVREGVFERGSEVARCVTARSMLIAMLCFALCLHVMVGMRVLMPA